LFSRTPAASAGTPGRCLPMTRTGREEAAAGGGKAGHGRGGFSPAKALVLAFGAAISLGTVALVLPQASSSGTSVGLINALFTATSAVCVTGLVVVDTGTQWSALGQGAILLLIQAGGLGIMTFSTLFALLVGKRINLRERLLIQETLNQVSLSGLVRLTRYVLIVSFSIEAMGAALLAARWSQDYALGRAVYLGVFHAVSAFNNAGFDLFSTSLRGYVGDAVTNLVVMFLIVVGGIGFTILADLYGWRRRGGSGRRNGLSLHSRVVLLVTGILIVVGAAAVYLLERGNPETLGSLGPGGALLAAAFQSITPRTAGFNTVPTVALRDATLFLLLIFMFIGGSPASTAGGIKTTTFFTLGARAWTLFRGRDEVELFERRLAPGTVERAFAVTAASAALVAASTMTLLVTEGAGFLPTLFEVTSAFGTVGLSVGLTSKLSAAGKLVVSLTMFAGRVGPLTIATLLAAGERRKTAVRYPEDRIVIG